MQNRTAQLIYQTVYCTLGFVGCVACLGIFDNINQIRWDFYVHFTNISNFLCIGVMLAALIQTAKKKEDSYVSAVPALKFIGMLGILLTFLPVRKAVIPRPIGGLAASSSMFFFLSCTLLIGFCSMSANSASGIIPLFRLRSPWAMWHFC